VSEATVEWVTAPALGRPHPADPAVLHAAPPLPAAADDARQVWSQLGQEGTLASLYRPAPAEWRLRPEALRRLLTSVDAAGRTGVTLAVCVQAASAVPLLQTGAATSPAVASVLDRVVRGEAVVALAATDADAIGSDLTGLGTTVTSHGSELVLTGGKRWITNATTADYLLTLARTRPGRHFTSFVWVLVPVDRPGVRVEPAPTALFAGSGTGHIRFEDVRLPTTHLVGRTGRALATFARHLTRERFAGAVWAVALTGRTLDVTRQLLQERVHDGEPLWTRDTLRHRFAEALAEVHGLDALTRHLQDRVLDRYDPAAAAVVKVTAAGVAQRVLTTCARLQGADGYLPGAAQQLRAEGSVFGIGGGTVDVMLESIADHAGDLLREVRSCGAC
jgi:alkylation response protein AidB-like acyl-CoA dehydrogenase